MFGRNRVRVPKMRKEKKVSLRDVWIAARLASTHTAGCHSMLNTLTHASIQHAAQLEALRVDVAEIVATLFVAEPAEPEADGGA
jgi:hypothetical protein